MPLFEDRFVLAVPADDPLPERTRVCARDVRARRLILLEGGHCLRDQALAYCAWRDATSTGLSATSLTTIMQMVASGYGVTLLPEVAIDFEVHDERIKLLRFSEPQPRRAVGLVWRPTSARKADPTTLGRVIVETLRTPKPRAGLVRSAELRRVGDVEHDWRNHGQRGE
jgi:LysR family hydrogen peroxide-inducible transcriptional activator